MEIIRKTILQAVTTGTTSSNVDGGFIIVPDLTAIYNIKIGLVQDVNDVGFLSAFVENKYQYYYYRKPKPFSFLAKPHGDDINAIGIGEELLDFFI